MTQKQKSGTPLAPQTPSETGFTTTQAPNVQEALDKAGEALRQAQKQKQRKMRMICTCGCPDCRVGPFTRPYYEDGESDE